MSVGCIIMYRKPSLTMSLVTRRQYLKLILFYNIYNCTTFVPDSQIHLSNNTTRNTFIIIPFISSNVYY